MCDIRLEQLCAALQVSEGDEDAEGTPAEQLQRRLAHVDANLMVKHPPGPAACVPSWRNDCAALLIVGCSGHFEEG